MGSGALSDEMLLLRIVENDKMILNNLRASIKPKSATDSKNDNV